MSTKSDVLKEFVRQVIREDDGGAWAADLTGGGFDTPYGLKYGSGQDLYKIFVEPFTDVFQVASGKTKELSVKAQTLGKAALKTIGNAFLPNVAADYENVFKQEKAQLDKIKQEYKDVYDRVWSAFEHDDVKVLAFFSDPLAAGRMMGYFGGKTGIKAALHIANSMSGGMLDGVIEKLKSRKLPDPVAQGVGGDVDEGRLYEATDKNKQLGNAVKKALNSEPAQKIENIAKKAISSSLNSIYSKAQAVGKAKSFHDLESAGIKIPPQAAAQLQKVPQDERTTFEADLMMGVKKTALSFYLKNLEAQREHAIKSGVPEQSYFVKSYDRVIQTIKTMV